MSYDLHIHDSGVPGGGGGSDDFSKTLKIIYYLQVIVILGPENLIDINGLGKKKWSFFMICNPNISLHYVNMNLHWGLHAVLVMSETSKFFQLDSSVTDFSAETAVTMQLTISHN